MAKNESLRGTLDLLVLEALSRDKRLSGFAIKQRIEMASKGMLRVRDSSLYPALARMMRAGWIVSYGESTGRRRARVWLLLKKGEAQFQNEKRSWSKFRFAVEGILRRAR